MLEARHILGHATIHSLVIVDELGRGTSSLDGMGIAFAICERLMELGALCFFATHFQDLAKGLQIYPSVTALHLESSYSTAQGLCFSHKVKDGQNEMEDYGLRLASQMGFPETIMKNAWKYSDFVSLM